MSTKQGNLLWHRMNVVLNVAVDPDPGPFVPGVTNVDTGIREFDSGREAGDPPLGGTALVGSRIQVLPCPGADPFGATWLAVTIGEPVLDVVTGTYHVTFTTQSTTQDPVNVLFLAPASAIGPGAATPYDPA